MTMSQVTRMTQAAASPVLPSSTRWRCRRSCRPWWSRRPSWRGCSSTCWSTPPSLPTDGHHLHRGATRGRGAGAGGGGRGAGHPACGAGAHFRAVLPRRPDPAGGYPGYRPGLGALPGHRRRAWRPHLGLMLLGLGLPGLDGFGVLEAVGPEHDRHPPVIVCSARWSVQDQATALALGATAHLAKPSGVDESLA